MLIWYQIISELFVNIAAGWFGVALFEPKIASVNQILLLILKIILGILSLFVAKFFKEKARRRRK